MMLLKKQVFGYNKSQVDELINEKDNEIKQLNDQIKKLQEDYQQLEHQKSLLQHRVNIQEQTNEEIARLALKEASELIDKAKKNANMILSESLEYVRSLSGEMSDFKAQAVKFRASVEKMSKDILESIDQSEVYNLINEDNTVTISAKIENPTNKNIVTISKKYSVNTNSTTNSYEAESILDVLKNEEINTGLYNLTVKDEKYNLRVYSFDGNLNIKTNTTFGTEEDVATASEYAKNMIVLKVNGDLTIDEGTTLTAYASKNGYGGPKGMTIYCTGTLTNNGTIDMTARGAKAVGQNVYLFKNADNTYEYVPAVGADGGKSVGGYEMKCNGKSGANGTDRQTGGGGSGSCYTGFRETAYSGAGAKGTSYSGGTGGGTWVGYSTGKSNDGDPNRWTRRNSRNNS